MGEIKGQSIEIADNGEVQILSYDELLKYHKGDSVWGLSVAYRALQLTANLFSGKNLWDRKNLFIVSSHPGPGVRDAIEYVTKCISRNQFRLTEDTKHQTSCSSSMKYEWKISYEAHSHVITLRNDFVPNEFYGLLDRLNTNKERLDDKKNFDEFKNSLVKKIWCEPITSSYLLNTNSVNEIINECI
ncbi:MAG: hypothetical protein R8M11_06145 [Gallionella sp.]